MSRAYYVLLYLGVVITAFWYWPFGSLVYEVPKVDALNRWIESILILGILLNFKKLGQRPLEKKRVFTILAFTSIAIVSSIFGQDLSKSIWGNQYRNDGLITLLHLVGFSFFIGLFWESRWQTYFAKAVAIVNTALSIWIIVDWMRFFLLFDESVVVWPNGGIGGPFGNPIYLAGYLVVAFPFTAYLLQTSSWKNKIYVSLAIFLQCISLLITNTSTAYFGIALIVSLYVFIRLEKQKKWYVLILAGVCVSAFLILSLQRFPREYYVAEGRPRIYMKTFLGALKEPLLGWGFANVDYAFDSSDWPIKILHNDKYVDKAHNGLLEVFATTGVVGLLSYGSIIFIVLRKLLRKINTKNLLVWDNTIFIVFLLYFIHSQTNVVSISEEIFFWFIVGQSLIPVEKKKVQ